MVLIVAYDDLSDDGNMLICRRLLLIGLHLRKIAIENELDITVELLKASRR